MTRMHRFGLVSTAAAAALFALGCGGSGTRPPGTVEKDLAFAFTDDGGDDGGVDPGPANLCGDHDPMCQDTGMGPDEGKPFPLPTDPMKDANQSSEGIGRNPNGWLQLDQTQASFHFIWLAQDDQGTVSKVDSRTLKEVARYSTVTCFSRPSGSMQQCDGMSGCCAADSGPQWNNRHSGKAEGPAQQVQLNDNSPSRTAVDFNGDLFVANRSFGGQASVTKIANDLSGCKDRNKNGRIDTSYDLNKDGRIDPSDPKEYFGLDDECILWTTNHGNIDATGRPLGLGPGANDTGPSDAWAGEFNTGKFFRVEGTTGKIKDEVQLPGDCQPYGLAVDAKGIGWAPNLGNGPLCYFDTAKNTNVGKARDPMWGEMVGYGVTLDRDQNVWVGMEVARYTPDRTNGFNNLGLGWWTRIDGVSGIGIAADSRTNKKYFVWSASGGDVIRIPASEIMIVKKDQTIPNPGNWLRINIPSYGVGVDSDQNIIGAPQDTTVYRAKLDPMTGDLLMNMQPDVNSPPKMGEQCPAGDRCDLGAHQYTYSDFTGFGLRNFTRPAGTYSYIFKGCATMDNMPQETRWYTIDWDADVPPNTTLTVQARSGPTSRPDNTWGMWTSDFDISPADLSGLVPNSPAETNASWLQVQFTFKTSDRNATPKLKSFRLAWKCPKIVM